MPARLVIVGSGETSPTMIKVHRQLLAEAPGTAAMLDTPFGFQVNADDLTDKIAGYFAESVGVRPDVARWRRRTEPAPVREKSLALLGRASWAFAGPGSPTYALREWRDTPVPAALVDLVNRGGTLVFGSAAAVTLGSHSVPVYEIYKVGDDPWWEPGLDLFGALLGVPAAVIPHYDNREGGRHDTRFCYLGEQRLLEMEAQLPSDVGVLGVDEHTAVILDLETGTAEVHGTGGLTLRHRDRERVVPTGERLSFAELTAALHGDDATARTVAAVSTGRNARADDAGRPDVPSLRAEAASRRAAFDAFLQDGDADGALAEALALEESIHLWQGDTLEGADLDVARSTLRQMLVAFAEVAQSGLRDDRELLAPFVELALTLRRRAREAKDFATSDEVRDTLISAGVEVRDTPDGAEWALSGC